VLAGAAVALAAKPVKGASYSGTFRAGGEPVTLTFKVSSNGKRVTNLHASNAGLYCSGGGPATPVKFKDGTISAKGTFKSTGHYTIAVGPKKGQIGSKLTVTGSFKSGCRETGTLKTTYVGFARCSGTSDYSTKVVRK
jgi:hypothetical protein